MLQQQNEELRARIEQNTVITRFVLVFAICLSLEGLNCPRLTLISEGEKLISSSALLVLLKNVSILGFASFDIRKAMYLSMHFHDFDILLRTSLPVILI